MQALDEYQRTDNFRAGTTCRVCSDDAQVVVGTHRHADAEYEDMGPCPFCLRGLRLETGSAGAKRWPDGFWQGRHLPDHLVEASVAPAELPLARQLQRQRLREMQAGMFPGEM